MNKEVASEILRHAPSVVAFQPPLDTREAEACVHGWIGLDVIRALAWWADNAPGESWGQSATQIRINQITPPDAEKFLPICAWCTKVRDDQGEWELLHRFLARFSNVRFTHGICPECMERQLAGLQGEPSD